MRWLVEVTSLGKDDRESLHVEAETWQKALQVARTQRGEAGPMTGFAIDLLDEGCRAVDPASRLRYEVRRAVATVPPPAAAAPAAHPAPASVPPRPTSHGPSTLRKPGQQPAPAAVTGQATGATAVVAVSAEPPAPPAPFRTDAVVVNVPSQIVFKREHEASETMPLTYREYVYVVQPGTTESAAESLLQAQLELVQTSLDRAPAGKLVNLAVFDLTFQGKPPVPPLATLTWKDWRGVPVFGFPRRAGQPAAVASPRAVQPVPQTSAQPVPATPQPFAQPATLQQPFAQTAALQQPFAQPVAAPDLSAFAAQPAAAPGMAAPGTVPHQPVAPVPVAPVTFAAAQVAPAPAPVPASFGGFPGMAPMQMQVGGAVPVPAIAPSGVFVPPPPEMAFTPPPPPPVAPYVAPAPIAAPPPVAPVVDMPASAPVPAVPGPRVGGEDLIADLFESMHDLHFVRDAVEGGDFCLVLAMEKLPCRAGIVHVFDINKREFLVANVRGAGTEGLLLRRAPEADPFLSAAMRKRRGVVMSQDELAEAAAVERYAALGGAQSLVIAPVMVAGRLLGAVELVNPLDGQPFTESDGNAVTYIAEQFAEFVSTRGIVTDPERISSRRVPEG